VVHNVGIKRSPLSQVYTQWEKENKLESYSPLAPSGERVVRPTADPVRGRSGMETELSVV